MKKQYGARSCNIAIQDGTEAGQSVPHVHVHILPRLPIHMEPFDSNDEIYEALEIHNAGHSRENDNRPQKDKEQNNNKLHVPMDSERKDRSDETMATEAAMLARAAFRPCAGIFTFSQFPFICFLVLFLNVYARPYVSRCDNFQQRWRCNGVSMRRQTQ